MPRFGSYDLMIARDEKFAFWTTEARQRFTGPSTHVRMTQAISNRAGCPAAPRSSSVRTGSARPPRTSSPPTGYHADSANP